jgi:thiamine monophosphate kinase
VHSKPSQNVWQGLCDVSWIAAVQAGDVTKAIKAAVNAGLAVMRIEIQDGKIVVVTGRPGDRAQANEWDEVR